MRIIADVATLISADRLIIVEHVMDGVKRSVSFPLSLYKRAHFSDDNESFRPINEYWESLDYAKQTAIYNIYEDIRELFDSPTGTVALSLELTDLVTKLMSYHITTDVARWIRNESNLKVPVGVPMEFVYDIDKNTTPDKTYPYDEYIGLMALSVIFRAMIPIWAMFTKPVKEERGKILKEQHSFLLLKNTELYKSEFLERLMRYIKANINKDTYTGNHTLEFIPSDDMPFYLLSLVCVRKLCLGEVYDEVPKPNLPAAIYIFIVDPPSPQGGDHSQQVRSKKLKKEGAGESNENSGSSLELYKARTSITPGRIAEMVYSLRDPVNLAQQLCPLADERLIEKDCKRALETIDELVIKGIQSPQIRLTQWVINPVFPAQGILCIEDESLIARMCAVTETVLRHRGFSYLALLSTAVALVEEGSMRLSPVSSKSQISEELSKALMNGFPYQREPKRKTATNSSVNFVQDDIKTLSQAFSRYTWRATADEALVREVLNTHVRRIPIFPSLRSDIASMLVKAEDELN